MLTAHPAHPLYPVGPEPLAEGSDQRLASSLRTPSWATDPYPLAALLGRHWEPVHDYAVLCAAPTDSSAGALAAAAVHQVFRSLERSGPVAALRPRLLMAVRDFAASGAVGPCDGSGTGQAAPGRGAGRSPTGPGAPARTGERRLALRSFICLPPRAQCLLWHTAVEAEPVSVPAALLALDMGTALTELGAARDRFRAGLLHAHTELAAHAACRFYGRLLDVQIQRGQGFPPDVQHHLRACPHCAAAAVQLGLFERRPGLLLAQAVLGGPAEDYLASRLGGRPPGGEASRSPGAARKEPAAAPREGRGRRPGRHRLLPGALPPALMPPVRACARALLAGASLASALTLGAVLPTALAPSGHPRTGSAVPDHADSSPAQSHAPGPGTVSGTVPPDPTSAVFAPASRPVAGVSPAVRDAASPLEESDRAVLRPGRG